MAMSLSTSQAKDLSQFWTGEILWDCPLAEFTTLKVGGPAGAVLFADKPEQLRHLLGWLRANQIPWRVIGRGSNILVPDEGFAGVVIILGRGFAAIEPLGGPGRSGAPEPVLVRVGAGCSLARLVNWCAAFPPHGLAGLEFAQGIPGSVGGAVIMNAGAWGMNIGQAVQVITMLDQDGRLLTEAKDQFDFAYRCWHRKAGASSEVIVLNVTFALLGSDQNQIKAACRTYHRRRRESQPHGVASAGSIFKNPAAQAAGRLIEEAELKGHRIGGAMVSPLHANFIINTGKATAQDILDLMREIQTRVFNRTGIMLEPEVHILGQGAGRKAGR